VALARAGALAALAAILSAAASPTLAAPEPATGLDLPSGLVSVRVPPETRPALCGFTIGAGALRLTWVEDRTLVTETARSFATPAAARRVMLANRARSRTAGPSGSTASRCGRGAPTCPPWATSGSPAP
jgi:hypothetical protein